MDSMALFELGTSTFNLHAVICTRAIILEHPVGSFRIVNKEKLGFERVFQGSVSCVCGGEGSAI